MNLPSLHRLLERMQSEIKMGLKDTDDVPGEGTTLKKKSPRTCVFSCGSKQKTVYSQHKNFSVEKEKFPDEDSTSFIKKGSYG